ncbi:hypothetical protein Tco_0500705 [Tanacetum coccineum]
MEALIEDENAMDKGVADTVKDHKRKHDDDEDDDDEDPPAGLNHGKKTKRRRTKESESSKKPSFTKETSKGKAQTKGSKTSKSASAKKLVEEPIAEVIMDDAGDDYLKTPYLELTYTTSIMEIKAAQYKIKGIEDMISKFSKQNVYSTKAILGVKSFSVKKLHGYSHLEEIVVKRFDQQLYKFKECDFVDLHLNDIEDMLLLVVQHKLFHLDGNVIVDFIMALRMFTRSLILKRRVEDLQLRVESYQKKLNITKPQKTFLDIEFKEPYTPSYDPPGIFVRDEIHHRVLDFHLDYIPEMPNRKWTAVDQKRLGLMIELIDKQLREREIIINLERLVGARELEMDYKLMKHIV